MYHPLYHQARQYSGRPVYVHHLNGRTYHGTIVSVNPRGLYLIQHPAGTSLTTGNQRTAGAEHAIDGNLSEFELVYSPAAFFGFGALTGLTLGTLAGGMWW